MIKAFAASHPGRKRISNQDSYFASEKHGIFVLADGMGGHRGGQHASQIAVEAFSERLLTKQPGKNFLYECIQDASKRIFDEAMAKQSLAGMGTTCTSCFVTKDGKGSYDVDIAHVGDSRVYYIFQDHIWLLTKDHTLLNEQVELGTMTRKQAERSIAKNVLVRSVGIAESIKVDQYFFRASAPAHLLLCSDGLSNMLKPHEIQFIVANNPNVESAVEEIIKASNNAGGEDNITAILVKLHEK